MTLLLVSSNLFKAAQEVIGFFAEHHGIDVVFDSSLWTRKNLLVENVTQMVRQVTQLNNNVT